MDGEEGVALAEVVWRNPALCNKTCLNLSSSCPEEPVPTESNDTASSTIDKVKDNIMLNQKPEITDQERGQKWKSQKSSATEIKTSVLELRNTVV